MRISVFGKVPNNDPDRELIKSLFVDISKMYDSVLVWQPFFESVKQFLTDVSYIRTFTSKEELADSTDILLSLGGDGTMLDT